MKSNHDNVIAENHVLANNKANTCVDPADDVCQVPSGTGILVLAADRNRVTSNEVRGNRTFGIGVANYCVGMSLSAAECAAIDIDPDADGNRVPTTRCWATASLPIPRCPRSSPSTWRGT